MQAQTIAPNECRWRMIEANVILAKCSKTGRTFGIRVEKRDNDWVCTWAFPIDEAKAKREGFNATKITGSLPLLPEYPGCPHCHASDRIYCGSCGKISCWGDNKSFHCHHCNTTYSDIEYCGAVEVGVGGH